MPVPSPSPAAPAIASAHLVVAVEHPFKRGTLRVWVDDEFRVEEPLESRPTKKLLIFQGRKGRETEVLVVAGDQDVAGGQTGLAVALLFARRPGPYPPLGRAVRLAVVNRSPATETEAESAIVARIESVFSMIGSTSGTVGENPGEFQHEAANVEHRRE